jgi:hypothetical protein
MWQKDRSATKISTFDLRQLSPLSKHDLFQVNVIGLRKMASAIQRGAAQCHNGSAGICG